MRLEFPVKFDLKYPEENLLYYSSSDKQIMLNLLLKACDSYCMYCGKSIKVDGKEEFNIEHSLEKSMVIEKDNFLKECKYNLSIACPSCNQKYKTRMIDPVPLELVNSKLTCCKDKCSNVCDDYREILNSYLQLNHIILQPNYIDNELRSYGIDYNLINHVFEPSIKCSDYKSRRFISDHIARFHLNREMYTKSIIRICEDICNKITIVGQSISIEKFLRLIKNNRYDNVMEKIFIEFLEKNINNVSDLYEYCKLSIILSYI